MAKKQNKIPQSYNISQFKNAVRDLKYEDDHESNPNNEDLKISQNKDLNKFDLAR